MSEEEKDSQRQAGKRGNAFPFFAGLSLLIVVAGVVWWFVVVRPAQSVAESTIDKVERFFGGLLGNQGKVTRMDSSSLIEIRDVGELALLEYSLKVNKEVIDETVVAKVLTSQKRLRMEGRFKVKIGYDISNGLSVGYDESGQAFLAGLGAPQVLSAEMEDITTMEDKSGIWNKVSGKDRDELVNQLRLQAIRDVKKSGLLEQMDEKMQRDLKFLLGVEDIRTGVSLEPTIIP